MTNSELTRHQKLVRWQWDHNSSASDLIRVFVGAALLVRGIWIFTDPSRLTEFAGDRSVDWIATYVMLAHIGGGVLLVVGFLTRLAAMIQLPILIVATFFVHFSDGFASPNQSLELSALMMVLLAVILVFGPGKRSVDYSRYNS